MFLLMVFVAFGMNVARPTLTLTKTKVITQVEYIYLPYATPINPPVTEPRWM